MAKPPLPPPVPPEIERLARLIPGWANATITWRMLAGGITNTNYLATLDDGSAFVLRAPGARSELLGIDRAGEVEASMRAAQIGVGPAVIGELPELGTLVTRFMPGSHSEFTPERLLVVVDLLKRFHNSGPLKHRFPIFRVVEWHARDAARLGVATPSLFEELHRHSARIEQVFCARGEPVVPCHNDLLPANVLFDGDDAVLLDFEYAGMNDRYFDLGNLSVNSELDEEADAGLLHTYFGRVTQADHACLQLMKIMSEFREGMWAVVQQAISELSTTDFRQYADQRLENCRRLIEQPQFEQALIDASEVATPIPSVTSE